MDKHLYAIGDTHGNWYELKRIIKKYQKTNLVHVGDVGLGFALDYSYRNGKTGLWEVRKSPRDPEFFPEHFNFIRGNHDSPSACEKYPHYLGDYGYNEKLGIFFIGGGFSIDAANRKEGIDWWHDEELSVNQLNSCVDLYEKIRPQIVISHECPASFQNEIYHGKNHYGFSRTSQALQNMLEIHSPFKWIAGHHHIKWEKTINKTQFRIVAINECYKIY